MRSLSGQKNPDKPADPIIVHPDVRRMLLTQKAISEGARMFVHLLAMEVDVMESDASEQRKGIADAKLALLTPIGKAFLTETGFESANLGLQIFGGHGFIQEWGMEQNVRDCRITTDITMRAMSDADEVGAASVDYLMYSGYIVLGYMWAMAQATALDKLAQDDCSEPDFYQAKLMTCDFYFEKLLPRTRSLVATMESGAESLMALDADNFSF